MLGNVGPAAVLLSWNAHVGRYHIWGEKARCYFNLMGDRQVEVFGKNLEGKEMTASRDVRTPESLKENEGIWGPLCKYKPQA